MPKTITTDKVHFIQEPDGRLGVGHSNPDEEAGGFFVLKLVPDDMLERAYENLLQRRREGK